MKLIAVDCDAGCVESLQLRIRGERLEHDVWKDIWRAVLGALDEKA